MYKRKGSRDASSLYASEDVETWRNALQRYSHALHTTIAVKRNANLLIELDRWWREEYQNTVISRCDDMHITREELTKVMQWKLLRGVHRPALQNLILQNSEESVINTSREAFAIMSTDVSKWKEAMKILSSLRGVGAATASAIMAPLYPMHCPFMADEVIEGTASASGDVVGKIDYTLKRYEAMRSALIVKATQLCRDNTDEWTAELVGRAMWTVSVIGYSAISEHSNEQKTEEQSEHKPKRRKKQEEPSDHQ